MAARAVFVSRHIRCWPMLALCALSSTGLVMAQGVTPVKRGVQAAGTPQVSPAATAAPGQAQQVDPRVLEVGRKAQGPAVPSPAPQQPAPDRARLSPAQVVVTPGVAEKMKQQAAEARAKELLSLKGVDPGPLGRGQARGSLNGRNLGALKGCSGQSRLMQEALDLLGELARAFGGGFESGTACGTFQRELALGVDLEPVGTGPWDHLGGSGSTMADGLVCLARDLGQAPGGRVVNEASTSTGTRVVQTLGLSKWDPQRKRAELYHLVKVCAPLIGCFDAQRQAITLERRDSDPAWPRPVRIGNYVVTSSHSVEVGADWSNSKLSLEFPEIQIPTPYGVLGAKPRVNYATALYPVDTPFPAGGSAAISHRIQAPVSGMVRTPVLQDTYGRGGVPFILNARTNLAPEPTFGAQPSSGPGDPALLVVSQPDAPVQGWTSQLAFGGRGVSREGTSNWRPGAGSGPFERPDFDHWKVRTPLEAAPVSHFDANAAFKYRLGLADVDFPVSNFSLVITVTPVISADYAAQFQLFSRESVLGGSCDWFGEFRADCGMAQAGMLTGSRVEERMDVKVRIEMYMDFGIPFVPDLKIDKGYTVPVASGQASAPAQGYATAPTPGVDKATRSPWAGVVRVAQVSPGQVFHQGMAGFSGTTASSLEAWVADCMKAPPATREPPPPTREPGDPMAIAPTLLPCNICVAGDTPGQSFARRLFETTARAPGATPWRCETAENTGCYDLCSYDPQTRVFLRAEQSPVEFMGADGQQCLVRRRDDIR